MYLAKQVQVCTWQILNCTDHVQIYLAKLNATVRIHQYLAMSDDISCLLIFMQLPKQTIKKLLHHNQKLAIEQKAAVVVTKTNLIL
jgi:hypothetical protein